MTRTCSTCQHWRPDPPQGWRPSTYVPYFGAYELRQHLLENGQRLAAWRGLCRRYPAQVSVTADYGCGEHVPADPFVESWREFAQPGEVQSDNDRLRAEVRRLAGVARKLRAKLSVYRSKGPDR